MVTVALAVGAVLAVGAGVFGVLRMRRRPRPIPVVVGHEGEELPDARCLAAAILASDDALVVVDEQGREVLRNAGAERYRRPRTDDVLVAAAMERVLVDALRGEPATEDVTLLGPSSAVFVVKAVPLFASGDVVGAMVAVRDVSEPRRSEQVRRDFVANVSHELKTPIGALTVLAETLLVAEDSEVQQQLADSVVREADRLARIVDGLLDLSRIEGDGMVVREPVPVAQLVADAIDCVRPAADTVGIPVLTTTLASDALAHCDRRQLASAVTNLLDNAVKYSEPGGLVEVSVVASGDTVEIRVRDHGIGIPARDLERVFERFYRVDRARSRETGGTGLGLAIVRNVARAHGGDVTVTSIEGFGSEFVLRIPAVATPSVAPPVPEGQDA